MQEKSLTPERFFTRLRQALDFRGVKPSPIAKKLGFSTGYMSMLLQGKRDAPSLEFIRALSSELDVREQWLLTGEGEMIDPGQQAAQERAVARHAAGPGPPPDPGGPMARAIRDAEAACLGMTNAELMDSIEHLLGGMAGEKDARMRAGYMASILAAAHELHRRAAGAGKQPDQKTK